MIRRLKKEIYINRKLLIYIDEFAIQTCFLGRYGQEIGSDEFGAMIMVSPETNVTNRPQQIAVRLSNVEVSETGNCVLHEKYI